MTGIKYGNFTVNSRIFGQLVLIFLILQGEKRYVTVGNKTSMLAIAHYFFSSMKIRANEDYFSYLQQIAGK